MSLFYTSAVLCALNFLIGNYGVAILNGVAAGLFFIFSQERNPQ